MKILIILTAFALDALIGDPVNPLHPVRLIGWLIARLTGLCGILGIKSNKGKLLYGTAMAVIVVGISFCLTFFALELIRAVNIYVGFITEAALCYFCLAARGLRDEAMKIREPLLRGDLSEARNKLSMIVGRDTEKLSEEKIVNATVETIAENLSDGVIAPLFFMFIGGAPLAMAYKAVNTLDSMVGYRNEKYEFLGKCAARLDDAVNFIPSRLSALFMICAAFVCRLDTKNSARIFFRDRKNHKSPNSAQTESACAGALGIRLGGSAAYGGRLVEKPFIGDRLRPSRLDDIKTAARLMYVSAVLALVIGAALSGVLLYV